MEEYQEEQDVAYSDVEPVTTDEQAIDDEINGREPEKEEINEVETAPIDYDEVLAAADYDEEDLHALTECRLAGF